jgi:hypothetical protein
MSVVISWALKGQVKSAEELVMSASKGYM